MKHKPSYFDEKKQFIVAEFSGFLRHDAFTSLANSTLKLLIERNADRILVDTSALEVMLPENQQWIQEVWFPKAIESGLKRLAFMTPRSAFGEASAKAANEKAEKESPIQIKYFFDRVQAEKWLAD